MSEPKPIRQARAMIRKFEGDYRREKGNVKRAVGDYIGWNPPPKRNRKPRRSGRPLLTGGMLAANPGTLPASRDAVKVLKKDWTVDTFDLGINCQGLYLGHPGWNFGSPLGVECQNSTHYRPLRVEVTWVPSAGSTQTGQLSIGVLPWGTKVKSSAMAAFLKSSPGGVKSPIRQSVTFKLDTRAYADKWYSLTPTYDEGTCPFKIVTWLGDTTAGLGSIHYSVTYEICGSTSGNHARFAAFQPAQYTVDSSSNTTSASAGDLLIMLEDYSVSTEDILVYLGEPMIYTSKTKVRLMRSGVAMSFDMDTTAGTAKQFEVAPLLLEGGV